MTYPKIKRKLYLLIPKRFQKKVKNFYYDGFLFPVYSLKYRFYYGVWNFFDSIALETTTHCNLRCEFCPNNKYDRGLLKNRKFMEISLFKKIINELSTINYRGQILLHFYGEPLTDERLPELVLYIKKKLPKAKIQINTNGFLLTIPLYKKLINAGVKSFLVTQYGKIMPPSIKKLFLYLKSRPKKDNKIKYRVLGGDIGLSNRGGEINVKNVVDYERPICLYPNTAIHVNYNGDVILCCNDYHSSVKFGNLKKESLFSLLKKPLYVSIKTDLKKKKFKLSICKKCVGIE